MMLKTFADDLRKIRLEKNITLEELTSQTRLRIVIFQKMEKGDFSFQPQTYIRAFVKQYAAALELNPDEVLKDYDDAIAGRYKTKFPPDKTADKIVEGKPEKPGEEYEAEIIQIQDSTEEKKVDEEKLVIEKFEEEEKEKPKDVRLEKEQIILPKPLPGKEHKPDKIRSTEKVELTDPESLKDGSFIRIATLKRGAFYAFIAAFLVGTFFMFQNLFFDSDSYETQIIRQTDFNEVVRESERNILGIRTEEEIQDSIRKAREEMMSHTVSDSLVLEVIAMGTGRIFVSIDSAKVTDPDSYYYEEGDTGLYIARNFFHFGVNDPATVEIYLNKQKLELPQRRRIRDILIDSAGVRDGQINR